MPALSDGGASFKAGAWTDRCRTVDLRQVGLDTIIRVKGRILNANRGNAVTVPAPRTAGSSAKRRSHRSSGTLTTTAHRSFLARQTAEEAGRRPLSRSRRARRTTSGSPISPSVRSHAPVRLTALPWDRRPRAHPRLPSTATRQVRTPSATTSTRVRREVTRLADRRTVRPTSVMDRPFQYSTSSLYRCHPTLRISCATGSGRSDGPTGRPIRADRSHCRVWTRPTRQGPLRDAAPLRVLARLSASLDASSGAHLRIWELSAVDASSCANRARVDGKSRC